MKKLGKKRVKKNNPAKNKTKEDSLDVKSKGKPREEWLHSKPIKSREIDLKSKQKGRETDLD